MTPIPPQQHATLNHIFNFWTENKHAPTVKEIAEIMHKSPATVRIHIMALVDKGLLSRIPMMKRSICLTDEAKRMFHNG